VTGVRTIYLTFGGAAVADGNAPIVLKKLGVVAAGRR
jgi:hypothetical protein